MTRTLIFFLLAAQGWAATGYTSADTYISSGSPGANYGSAATLAIGGGNSALILLDLSSLPTGLTALNIQKAAMTVYVNSITAAGGLDIAPVTGSWLEGSVTYSAQPNIGAVALTDVPVNTASAYLTFDITALVQQWVSGTANYGVEISAAALQPNTSIVLDSKESTSTSHPAFATVILVVAGPQGPSGPVGVAGATGIAGPQGTAGPVGPAGPSGSQGPIGSQGPQGLTGASGSQGQTGSAGPAGGAGPLRVQSQGAWSSATSYLLNDVVSYNNSSWLALTANQNTTPGASTTTWALVAIAGPPGSPGGLTIAYAAQVCANYGYVTGIDASGNLVCSTGSATCSAATFNLSMNSYSYVNPVNSLAEEAWPVQSFVLGTGGCSIVVQTPGTTNGPDGPIGCLIDGSQNCQPWRAFGPFTGFSSCTITPSTPVCGSKGSHSVTQANGFPACSSALSNGSHSTDTATVTCQ